MSNYWCQYMYFSIVGFFTITLIIMKRQMHWNQLWNHDALNWQQLCLGRDHWATMGRNHWIPKGIYHNLSNYKIYGICSIQDKHRSTYWYREMQLNDGRRTRQNNKETYSHAEIISIIISDIYAVYLKTNIFWCGTGNNSKLPCASANYIKPNLRVTRSRGFNVSTDINNVRRGNFAWTVSAIKSGCINFWNWQKFQIFRRNIRLSCGEHNWIFTVNCK